jgi:hypothetical protein
MAQLRDTPLPDMHALTGEQPDMHALNGKQKKLNFEESAGSLAKTTLRAEARMAQLHTASPQTNVTPKQYAQSQNSLSRTTVRSTLPQTAAATSNGSVAVPRNATGAREGSAGVSRNATGAREGSAGVSQNRSQVPLRERACNNCGALPHTERMAHPDVCTCEQVIYCSTECAEANWPIHMDECTYNPDKPTTEVPSRVDAFTARLFSQPVVVVATPPVARTHSVELCPYQWAGVPCKNQLAKSGKSCTDSHGNKFQHKVLCKDKVKKGSCPRGKSCTWLHTKGINNVIGGIGIEGCMRAKEAYEKINTPAPVANPAAASQRHVLDGNAFAMLNDDYAFTATVAAKKVETTARAATVHQQVFSTDVQKMLDEFNLSAKEVLYYNPGGEEHLYEFFEDKKRVCDLVNAKRRERWEKYSPVLPYEPVSVNFHEVGEMKTSGIPCSLARVEGINGPLGHPIHRHCQYGCPHLPFQSRNRFIGQFLQGLLNGSITFDGVWELSVDIAHNRTAPLLTDFHVRTAWTNSLGDPSLFNQADPFDRVRIYDIAWEGMKVARNPRVNQLGAIGLNGAITDKILAVFFNSLKPMCHNFIVNCDRMMTDRVVSDKRLCTHTFDTCVHGPHGAVEEDFAKAFAANKTNPIGFVDALVAHPYRAFRICWQYLLHGTCSCNHALSPAVRKQLMNAKMTSVYAMNQERDMICQTLAEKYDIGPYDDPKDIAYHEKIIENGDRESRNSRGGSKRGGNLGLAIITPDMKAKIDKATADLKHIRDTAIIPEVITLRERWNELNQSALDGLTEFHDLLNTAWHPRGISPLSSNAKLLAMGGQPEVDFDVKAWKDVNTQNQENNAEVNAFKSTNPELYSMFLGWHLENSRREKRHQFIERCMTEKASLDQDEKEEYDPIVLKCRVYGFEQAHVEYYNWYVKSSNCCMDFAQFLSMVLEKLAFSSAPENNEVVDEYDNFKDFVYGVKTVDKEYLGWYDENSLACGSFMLFMDKVRIAMHTWDTADKGKFDCFKDFLYNIESTYKGLNAMYEKNPLGFRSWTQYKNNAERKLAEWMSEDPDVRAAVREQYDDFLSYLEGMTLCNNKSVIGNTMLGETSDEVLRLLIRLIRTADGRIVFDQFITERPKRSEAEMDFRLSSAEPSPLRQLQTFAEFIQENFCKEYMCWRDTGCSYSFGTCKHFVELDQSLRTKIGSALSIEFKTFAMYARPVMDRWVDAIIQANTLGHKPFDIVYFLEHQEDIDSFFNCGGWNKLGLSFEEFMQLRSQPIEQRWDFVLERHARKPSEAAALAKLVAVVQKDPTAMDKIVADLYDNKDELLLVPECNPKHAQLTKAIRSISGLIAEVKYTVLFKKAQCNPSALADAEKEVAVMRKKLDATVDAVERVKLEDEIHWNTTVIPRAKIAIGVWKAEQEAKAAEEEQLRLAARTECIRQFRASTFQVTEADLKAVLFYASSDKSLSTRSYRFNDEDETFVRHLNLPIMVPNRMGEDGEDRSYFFFGEATKTKRGEEDKTVLNLSGLMGPFPTELAAKQVASFCSVEGLAMKTEVEVYFEDASKTGPTARREQKANKEAYDAAVATLKETKEETKAKLIEAEEALHSANAVLKAKLKVDDTTEEMIASARAKVAECKKTLSVLNATRDDVSAAMRTYNDAAARSNANLDDVDARKSAIEAKEFYEALRDSFYSRTKPCATLYGGAYAVRVSVAKNKGNSNKARERGTTWEWVPLMIEKLRAIGLTPYDFMQSGISSHETACAWFAAARPDEEEEEVCDDADVVAAKAAFVKEAPRGFFDYSRENDDDNGEVDWDDSDDESVESVEELLEVEAEVEDDAFGPLKAVAAKPAAKPVAAPVVVAKAPEPKRLTALEIKANMEKAKEEAAAAKKLKADQEAAAKKAAKDAFEANKAAKKAEFLQAKAAKSAPKPAAKPAAPKPAAPKPAAAKPAAAAAKPAAPQPAEEEEEEEVFDDEEDEVVDENADYHGLHEGGNVRLSGIFGKKSP